MPTFTEHLTGASDLQKKRLSRSRMDTLQRLKRMASLGSGQQPTQNQFGALEWLQAKNIAARDGRSRGELWNLIRSGDRDSLRRSYKRDLNRALSTATRPPNPFRR